MYIENIKKTIEEILNGNEEQGKPSLKSLQEKDISHVDFGADLSLQEANQIKNERCKILFEIIADIQSIIEEKQYKYLVPNPENELTTYIASLINFNSEVESFIQTRIDGNETVPNLKGKRNNIIDLYKNSNHFISQNLRVQIAYNEIFKIKKLLDEDSSSDERIKKLKKNLNESEEALADLLKKISIVQDTASNVSRDQASQAFNGQVEEHKKYSKNWFRGLIASAIVLAVSILVIVCCWEIPYNKGIEAVIFSIFKRVLLVATVGIFLRICLRKYNTERHLEITYKHRAAALDQYGLFEAKISQENEEAKNKLRLSVANIIFNDPNTGFIEGDKNLNISPAVNLVEDAVKKGG